MRETSVEMPEEIADGLILRRAVAADADALAAFNARVHLKADGSPDEVAAIETQDMLRPGHPAMAPDDFLIIAERATGEIVSSLCLISQRWTYDGIPFGVGRIEFVGTAQAYRRRGLVRRLFAAIHAESAARGEQVQAITGIPWYYRQFGYAMALELNASRSIARTDIPPLPVGEPEPYHLRAATDADIPFLAICMAAGDRRSRVACLRDDTLWRYELHGRSDGNGQKQSVQIIETPSGAPVGFLSHYVNLWQHAAYIRACELAPGVSWLPVAPVVLRFMERAGVAIAARAGGDFRAVGFDCGAEHPLYALIASKLRGTDRPPYAWYVRVADLPAFLRTIAPALEARVARSILVGHTGTIDLNFYRTGLRLTFAGGKLTGAETWQPTTAARGDVSFPDLTFLQLLFGDTSLRDLDRTFPDCMIRSDEARALLNILFPTQPSAIWPIA